MSVTQIIPISQSSDIDVVREITAFDDEIRQLSDAIEDARQIPQELGDKLSAAGLFRVARPKVYGGLECSPLRYYEFLEQASVSDASVGWVLMIINSGGMMLALMEEDSVNEWLTENPDAVLTGAGAPIGKATPVDGGYKVSGKWPFGSGSNLTHYMFGGCIVDGGGSGPILAAFDVDDVTIHDTWHVSGLCGTSSNHFEVQDLFVPEKHCIHLGHGSKIDTPAYKFTQFTWGAIGVAAVSSGIALRAIESFRELATKKTPTGKTSRLARQPATQKDFARAVARVESARVHMCSVLNTSWEEAQNSDLVSVQTHADIRLACNNVTWSATEAVDLLYHLAGGSAIYNSNVLQRCLRDVHVTTQHISVNQGVYESVGQVLLGGDLDMPETANL